MSKHLFSLPSNASLGRPASFKELLSHLSRSTREESWTGHLEALDGLRSLMSASLPPVDQLRALSLPLQSLLSCERSALVGATADTLLHLTSAHGAALSPLATEALYTRLLENGGSGNSVNARHNASVALHLCSGQVGCSALWTALLRTQLRGEEGGGGGSSSSGGSSGGGGSSSSTSSSASGSTQCALGTRELCLRLLNTCLGGWSAEVLQRALGLGSTTASAQATLTAAAALLRSGCPRGEVCPSAALVALLTLGLVDSSQALRRLGRVNFRLLSARAPALVEVCRALNSRSNARQLASVLSEEGQDRLALGAAGADLLLLAIDSVPILYQAPEGSTLCSAEAAPAAAAAAPNGSRKAASGGGAPSRSSSQPPLAQAPTAGAAAVAATTAAAPPAPSDPAAALLDLASHMKGVLAGLMASMQPQLALLSQLDRRLREANLAAVSSAGERGGAEGSLAMAGEVLARAAGSGSCAPLPGAVLAGAAGGGGGEVQVQQELAEACASFSAWAATVEGSVASLRGKLAQVGQPAQGSGVGRVKERERERGGDRK